MSGQIGEALRAAREARGIELAEVQRVTKIRARFLAAIEEGEWDVLPGRAYATGFVRTYAEFLDLDPAPLLADLRGELEPGEHQDEVPPEPIVQPGTLPTGLRGRSPLRLLAATLGIAAALALAALAIVGGDDASDSVSGPPPALEEDPAPDDADESAVADEDDPEPDEPERAELALEAVGTVWVCVVDGGGDALVAGETLAEGESRGPFEARRMLMTFGNGMVALTANGEPFEVPEAASPIGFEVTADGVVELAPPDHPTCA